MNQIEATDTFLQKTLLTYLHHQRAAYMAQMPDADIPIAEAQATYETAMVAFSAIAYFVTSIKANAKNPLPDNWQEVFRAFELVVCQTGDDKLRELGYNPEEF